jgi:hypothetical protein
MPRLAPHRFCGGFCLIASDGNNWPQTVSAPANAGNAARPFSAHHKHRRMKMTKAKLITSICLASLPTVFFADAAHAQSNDQMATMLARAEDNRDGVVSRSEFAAVRAAMFD